MYRMFHLLLVYISCLVFIVEIIFNFRFIVLFVASRFTFKYLYCNMFNSSPEDCQIPLWKAIDTSKYYKPHESFIETYMELYPNSFSETKHIIDEELYGKMATDLIDMYRWRYCS